MRPTSRELSRRDPAAAVLLGAMAAAGTDFGWEPGRNSQRSQFGVEFGGHDPWGHDPGYNWGRDPITFGWDHYGADAPPAAVQAAPRPTPQAMMAAWNNEVRRHQQNMKREMLLEPNKGAEAKVERYTLPISQSITIGTAAQAISLLGNPSVNLRPQRVTMNAPSPSFVFISLIQVANVVVTVGPGTLDAYDFNPNAVGTSLDLPTLTPANSARVQGTNSGFIPPGYTNGATTTFVANFMGWASIIA